MKAAKNIRIVFMGTPDFAVASLKSIVEAGYNVVGVITAPDRPAGRGKKIVESAVKKFAVEKGLKVLQPEKLKNQEFLNELRSLNADLQVVVAFRMLPEVVWAMPRLGTFNLHGSLLPQYRGAAPLNWAIMNGESKTGVTTFLLDHEIDTGKILFKKETNIGIEETVGDVHDRLMHIGASLVLETIEALATGNYKPIPQSELSEGTEIKHAPKIFKEDCKLDWKQKSEKIRNLIRGLSPYPAAWSNLVNIASGEKTMVKIFFAKHADNENTTKPGSIKSDGKTTMNVACNDGYLSILELQLSGKKRMKTEDFLRGFQQINDYRFE